MVTPIPRLKFEPQCQKTYIRTFAQSDQNLLWAQFLIAKDANFNSCGQRRLCSHCVGEQTDLSLRFAPMNRIE